MSLAQSPPATTRKVAATISACARWLSIQRRSRSGRDHLQMIQRGSPGTNQRPAAPDSSQRGNLLQLRITLKITRKVQVIMDFRKLHRVRQRKLKSRDPWDAVTWGPKGREWFIGSVPRAIWWKAAGAKFANKKVSFCQKTDSREQPQLAKLLSTKKKKNDGGCSSSDRSSDDIGYNFDFLLSWFS